ncbi:hypothetical protein DFR74_11897, partial [Nocardia puris]
MKSTKLALATILTTAALAATTGTSAASPDVGVINFSASATETSSIISIDAGSLVVEDQVVKI